MARGISISVAPQFYVLLAGMCVLIPLPWVMGWILAAMLHELFHCLAIWLCGMKISYLHIGPDGAKIGAGDLSGPQSVLCALAGPFGGLFTACVGGLFPQLSICAAVQSMYNLLPVYPLDAAELVDGTKAPLYVAIDAIAADHPENQVIAITNSLVKLAAGSDFYYEDLAAKYTVVDVIYKDSTFAAFKDVKFASNPAALDSYDAVQNTWCFYDANGDVELIIREVA